MTFERYELSRDKNAKIQFGYIAPSSAMRGPDRPRIIIQYEQIEFLRELQFSWAKIACLLGVSESTIHHKRNEYNIPEEHNSWTTISGKILNFLDVYEKSLKGNSSLKTSWFKILCLLECS